MSDLIRVDFDPHYGVEDKEDGDFCHYWQASEMIEDLQQQLKASQEECAALKLHIDRLSDELIYRTRYAIPRGDGDVDYFD